MLEFRAATANQGILERRFDLTPESETIPGILWTPEGATGPRPLILIGHGGIQHKRIPLIVELAQRFTGNLGYAVAAIDAPGHGERISRDERLRQREERAARPLTKERYTQREQHGMARRNLAAAAEWRTTIDALQRLPEIGVDSPVGYWGVSMATGIGVPLVESEPRIKAAVLGLSGMRFANEGFQRTAAGITVPLLFIFHWDDEIVPREAGLNLYDAFGSRDKMMVVNPGPHLPILPHEQEASEVFFRRQFGTASA